MELNGGNESLFGRSNNGVPSKRRRVGLIYDDRMCEHTNPDDENYVEKPDRIRVIWNILNSSGITQRCVVLNAKEATDNHLALVHTKKIIDLIKNISSKKTKSSRKRIASRFDSIYFSEGSTEAAYLAAGSVIEVAEKVAKGELDSAFAIVRPPGHHAENDECMGFCLYNNVAIATSYLLDKRPELGIRKILIVDWDVHHGNGTQNAFYKDPRALVFSVHRHEKGTFYPGGDDGSYSMVGGGPGEGYNINVPWENGGCGDADYLAVWDHILIPVAKEFDPDLIIISAGFDAAIDDPLGGCCVSPFGFSAMLHKLMNFAGGKIVMALEGGYNLNSLAKSAKACVQVLLDEKPIAESWETTHPLESTVHIIQAVRNELSTFWPMLDVIILPDTVTSKRKSLIVVRQKFDSPRHDKNDQQAKIPDQPGNIETGFCFEFIELGSSPSRANDPETQEMEIDTEKSQSGVEMEPVVGSSPSRATDDPELSGEQRDHSPHKEPESKSAFPKNSIDAKLDFIIQQIESVENRMAARVSDAQLALSDKLEHIEATLKSRIETVENRMVAKLFVAQTALTHKFESKIELVENRIVARVSDAQRTLTDKLEHIEANLVSRIESIENRIIATPSDAQTAPTDKLEHFENLKEEVNSGFENVHKRLEKLDSEIGHLSQQIQDTINFVSRGNKLNKKPEQGKPTKRLVQGKSTKKSELGKSKKPPLTVKDGEQSSGKKRKTCVEKQPQPPKKNKKDPSPSHLISAREKDFVSSVNCKNSTASNPSSTKQQNLFWTSCPCSCLRYQYHRKYVNRSLRCPTCSNPFIACEIISDVDALGLKSGGQLPDAAHIKPECNQTSAPQQKGVPNLRNCK